MGLIYRSFRNPDPPSLVLIWNDALTGRGAVFLEGVTPLEHYVLAKPYFDPKGLIVAEDEGTPVGFVHAGFGPDETGERFNLEAGVICVLAVRSDRRRRGIGRELLHRAEAYLREKGAKTIYFGGMRPLHPFYWGLYGGSELPGMLVSDQLAEPFLLANRYTVWDRCLVFQRKLEAVPGLGDARFAALKRQYKFQMQPRPVTGRWVEDAALEPCDVQEFQLIDQTSEAVAARAVVWEMDLYSWRWHHSSVGIMSVEVEAALRRRGLGKFLLTLLLRHLHDQFFTLVEVQTMHWNTAALALYAGLGFAQVDEGRVYRLQ